VTLVPMMRLSALVLMMISMMLSSISYMDSMVHFILLVFIHLKH